jgi:hypothetical protein
VNEFKSDPPSGFLGEQRFIIFYFLVLRFSRLEFSAQLRLSRISLVEFWNLYVSKDIAVAIFRVNVCVCDHTQCLPKRSINFNTRRGSSLKAEVVHILYFIEYSAHSKRWLQIFWGNIIASISTLKMEATRPSETLGTTYKITRRHNPEDKSKFDFNFT